MAISRRTIVKGGAWSIPAIAVAGAAPAFAASEPPAIQLLKTASQSTYVAGDIITYTFTVTNSGTVDLREVYVWDGNLGIEALPVLPVGEEVLAPGNTRVVTATYVITQADVDAGSIFNEATVTGISPADLVATATDDVTITSAAGIAPAIDLVKTVDPEGTYLERAGQKITYSFYVTNTGNVTLQDIYILDPALGNGQLVVTDVLAVGESVTVWATWVVTADAMAAGEFCNVATVYGTSPSGDAVTDEDDVCIFTTEPASPGGGS